MYINLLLLIVIQTNYFLLTFLILISLCIYIYYRYLRKLYIFTQTIEYVYYLIYIIYNVLCICISAIKDYFKDDILIELKFCIYKFIFIFTEDFLVIN